jgi:hypothetical protein
MSRKTKVVERKLGREHTLEKAFQGLNEIHIGPRQPPKEYLDTLVHEALHLAFPDLNEEAISEGASMVARVLWAQNFRKCNL